MIGRGLIIGAHYDIARSILSCIDSGGSRPLDKGEPGHPDPEIRGGGPGLKKFFSALRASVWSKKKGRTGSPGPFLDPPLIGLVFNALSISIKSIPCLIFS